MRDHTVNSQGLFPINVRSVIFYCIECETIHLPDGVELKTGETYTFIAISDNCPTCQTFDEYDAYSEQNGDGTV